MGESGDELAEQFADVATQLAIAGSAGETLQRIADLAVEVVAACDHAGVTVAQGDRLRTLANSDDIAKTVDDAQHATDQGPCLDAIRSGQTLVSIEDLLQEDRWPAFTDLVSETPVASALAVLLRVDGQAMGSLNLYADRVGAFDDRDHAVATVFAVHATVAMRELDQVRHLYRALEGRDLIGQAKGILMERENVDADAAFAMLVTASQHANRKLREIAAAVVDDSKTRSTRQQTPPHQPG